MICTDLEYATTLAEYKKLCDALAALGEVDSANWISTAQRDALSSQVSDLELQMAEYIKLKEGALHISTCSDLNDLPRILIQARISLGLSQLELANVVSLPLNTIKKYESSYYKGVSLKKIVEIASALKIKFNEDWSGVDDNHRNSIYTWSEEGNIKWELFPIREMIKKGWLKLKNKQSLSDAARDYFSHAAGFGYASVLHRKKFHGNSLPNEYALLAWQARVLEKARTLVSAGGINEFELNDSWINDLVRLSIKENAPELVKCFLAKHGIVLVIEEHLSGTYLDGAAMLLESGNPIVALTLRHDRLDNFWFVLMHELGHVFLHLHNSLQMDFFDEEGDGGCDDLEMGADKFALNHLIPEPEWDLCLSRFLMTEESVVIDAENLKIHPSIIAGRIRNESSNYIILSNLVGHGMVRKYLRKSDD
ncbi:XRE family transcriptional regulator [Chromobacterium haemolyticum]|uniref:XRE family transcriptional regulator n=1 Tax=Chromobacterium haemolyticum TaxID=394935 RepID=UPI0009DDE503|nr:XRE family transcriptional regulator [Chromobacterium haemolyticum]